MDEIEQEILETLKSKFGGSPQPDDPLALLGVDSLGMAELLAELEKHYHLRITEEIYDISTVRELAEYVRRNSDSN